MILPSAIRSRFVEGVNGMRMHVLEAGKRGGVPVLLLHGFPELAYSWRKVMPALAEAGFHVIAPDQRGFGMTTGWDARYDGDLASYGMLNLIEDVAQLLDKLDIPSAHFVGHDFGAPVIAYCALARPQLMRSCVLMSAPFGGVAIGSRNPRIHEDLAALGRKHYQWYYSTREADNDMRQCAQGVHAFLRAYFHYKSADWPGNKPFRLKDWIASELVKMPTYYIMELDKDMAQTVAPFMPAAEPRWLPDDELAVYTEAFERHGFQGGLQWYRCAISPRITAELNAALAGGTIDKPALFIAGAADWGTYQKPGEFERMQSTTCTDFRGAHLVPGAGHWVQQEQPARTTELLTRFLKSV